MRMDMRMNKISLARGVGCGYVSFFGTNLNGAGKRKNVPECGRCEVDAYDLLRSNTIERLPGPVRESQ